MPEELLAEEMEATVSRVLTRFTSWLSTEVAGTTWRLRPGSCRRCLLRTSRPCSSSIAVIVLNPDPLQPLHRDPWLLAVNKPAGLLSQPGLGPDQQDSLITRLLVGDGDLHLVHRLDRDTSGVLLLARGLESLRRCSALFAQRRVNKLYLAEIDGVLIGRGCLDAPWPGCSASRPATAVIPRGAAAARSGESAVHVTAALSSGCGR